MEGILQELSSLPDSELGQRLRSAGISFGGISQSTRRIYQKKLATHILKARGGVQNDDDEDESCENTQRMSAIDSSQKDPTAIKVQVCSDEAAKAHTLTENAAGSADKASNGNTSSSVSSETFYVVCSPCEEGEAAMSANSSTNYAQTVTTKISQNKREVLKLMKGNAESRFKTFKSLEEAQNFAKLQTNLFTPKKSSDPAKASEAAVSERANSYRSPKAQQLNALRFAIEKADAEKFKTLVHTNPRYLVTAVDSPTFLHEGCKYNALHVAAMKNLPDMMRLILETLSDPSIPRLLYPSDSEDSVADRWDFVLHLYLNSPEKGNGETPLHFASKFGFVECVRILLDRPKCNKKSVNKYGQKASEIICNRYRNSDKEEVTAIIAELLDDHFYVPMWRAEDNSVPAVIGEPWSPDVPNSQSALLSQQAKGSPIESNISLRAFAGPMSPSKASEFQKIWKTPPSSSKKMSAAIRRGDSEKGVERIGRNLAKRENIAWMEYWSFLDEFVDLSSRDGLQALEQYLSNVNSNVTDTPIDAHSSDSKPLSAPASVMKNLVSEFSTTSPPREEEAHIKAGSEVRTQAVDSMDACKSHTLTEQQRNGSETRLGTTQSGTVTSEKTSNESRKCARSVEKMTCRDTCSEGDIKNGIKSTDKASAPSDVARDLFSDLQRLSLSEGEKQKGNVGKEGVCKVKVKMDTELNAGGDSTRAVQDIEGMMGARTADRSNRDGRCLRRISNERVGVSDVLDERNNDHAQKEMPDFSLAPKVSLPLKPIKNSTDVVSSREAVALADDQGSPGHAPGPSQDSDNILKTPERNDPSPIRRILFSPVQMITGMMSRLHSAAFGSSVGGEESDVDDGQPVGGTTSTRLEHECAKEGQTCDADVHAIGHADGSSCSEVSCNQNSRATGTLDVRMTKGAGEGSDFVEKSSSSHPTPTPPCLETQEKPEVSDRAEVREQSSLSNQEPCQGPEDFETNAPNRIVSSSQHSAGNSGDEVKGHVDGLLPTSRLCSVGNAFPPKLVEFDSGDASFHTPVNQRIMGKPLLTGASPCNSAIFINGERPSKLDLHVLRAIEGVEIADEFPLVLRWKRAVEGIPEETRQRWRTPVQTRVRNPSSPQSRQAMASPLANGRSPILQRLRQHWSEPGGRSSTLGQRNVVG